MVLMLLHVGQSINADQGTNNGNDHAHDHGKLITIQGRAGSLAGVHEQFEESQRHDLQHGEDRYQFVLELIANSQNDKQECKIEDGDKPVGMDAVQGFHGQGECPGLHQEKRCQRDNHAGSDNQHGPEG